MMRYQHIRLMIFSTAVMLFFALLMMPELAHAQCSMCKQALETGGSGNLLSGLKWSIIFMIIPPTIMTAGIGFLVIKSGKPSTTDTPSEFTDHDPL